jgi:hypothetical protein
MENSLLDLFKECSRQNTRILMRMVDESQREFDRLIGDPEDNRDSMARTLNRRSIIYQAIIDKSMTEKMSYFDECRTLYNLAIKDEDIDRIDFWFKEIEGFRHSFLNEIPLDYL